MIDILNKVITAVSDAVTEEYEDCFVSGEYLRAKAKLPAVTVMEYRNITPFGAIDSGSMENYAEVLYQTDVYSADSSAKKTEAREIAKLVDSVMLGMGFRRTYYQALPNQNNATLYRLTARYEGKVLKDGRIAQ